MYDSDLQLSYNQQVGPFDVNIMIGSVGIVITVRVKEKEVDEFEP